jgi:glyoxylase-like metal-dependent hydrolase (beta-lactamase superfamily II)
MWDQLGDGVYRRNYEFLAFNVGLVVGSDGALVVDTRASKLEAAEILRDVRTVTSLPVRWAVDTHWHWDHAFGNSEFTDAVIWGHVECRRVLSERGEEAKLEVADRIPEKRDEFLAVEIRLPDRVLSDRHVLDLGGRTVTVTYHGRGHTEGDVVVEPDGSGVCFGGDLIEESGPPNFGDGFPVAWPGTLRRVLDGGSTMFVPGHGEVMAAAEVTAQLAELEAVAALAIESHRAGVPLDAVDLARSPYPAPVTAEAMERAYLELGDVAPGADPLRR